MERPGVVDGWKTRAKLTRKKLDTIGYPPTHAVFEMFVPDAKSTVVDCIALVRKGNGSDEPYALELPNCALVMAYQADWVQGR